MSNNMTMSQLHRLEKFYNSRFRSSFLDNALQKIIATQIMRDEVDLSRINDTLKKFEQQNNLTTQEFFQLFQAGKMPDTADMMEWNIACKMKQRIITRIQILRGVNTDE